MSIPQGPRADGTVRLAVPADADAIARIQGEAWSLNYSALLPADAADAFDVADATTGWTAAITAPPTNRHHVLVAL
ncbi:MAG: hypothetical protein QOG68_2211, partial [Solirubrobacteraceae bacterium]|nr:hypothetical protein [Solirubrobacteraceae bacterium]